MRGAALLDVDFVDTEMPGESFRFDERCVPLPERDNALRVKFGKDQLFLRPDAAHSPQPGIEQGFPFRARPLLQGIHVVTHLEQTTTRFTAVNDLIKPVSDPTAGKAFEPGV